MALKAQITLIVPVQDWRLCLGSWALLQRRRARAGTSARGGGVVESEKPFTHHGAIDEDADSHREPKVHAGESERVAAILQPGDLLLFLYSTKHAAVPNLSDQDRCLLYSVYGPENVQDEINCCDGRPSLKTYSKAEAEILLMMANALQ
ncbi:unnamed protein product [Durusdinium trenchii]|uniref:Phytanoyl-CoA dioxygenase n=1 Tax=Durusdinium trenchii TaxID=1381693 RepID=A0ABP0RDH0_9DINO